MEREHMKIIQIVGTSNSGKTTFIKNLIPELKKLGTVAVIKHLGTIPIISRREKIPLFFLMQALIYP
jgi:GTPase SAR1 family protein